MAYRRIMLSGAMLFALLFLSSFTIGGASVTIVVTGLKSNKGAVLISLFDNEQSFPREAKKAVGKSKALIQAGEARVTFKELPNGRYAAAILHDENNNLKMDFNLLGMPKEGYGFSNNVSGAFGPPSFSKAAFTLNGLDKTIIIKANYFPLAGN